MQRRLGGGPPASVGAILFAAGDWLMYAALTPGVFAIARRWPLSRPLFSPHLGIHIAMSFVFCAAWAAAGMLLRTLLAFHWAVDGPGFVSWFFITLPFGVAVYFAMVGTEHGIRHVFEARERETQLATMSGQLAQARFSALRAQVNPHFMFNTLNTVAVLVRDGEQRAATRIIEQFGDVLRRTLDRNRRDETSLEEELDLVREYLAIEQARFSDRLQPEFDIEGTVRGAAVPSFVVQHLVENAIRHGIARRIDAGRVTVAARRNGDTLEVSVADDGVGLDKDMTPAAGHGIDSTRGRLMAMYGGRASLEVASQEGGGAKAVLRVPFREIGE